MKSRNIKEAERSLSLWDCAERRNYDVHKRV